MSCYCHHHGDAADKADVRAQSPGHREIAGGENDIPGQIKTNRAGYKMYELIAWHGWVILAAGLTCQHWPPGALSRGGTLGSRADKGVIGDMGALDMSLCPLSTMACVLPPSHNSLSPPQAGSDTPGVRRDVTWELGKHLASPAVTACHSPPLSGTSSVITNIIKVGLHQLMNPGPEDVYPKEIKWRELLDSRIWRLSTRDMGWQQWHIAANILWVSPEKYCRLPLSALPGPESLLTVRLMSVLSPQSK